jgi:hypothetical protein
MLGLATVIRLGAIGEIIFRLTSSPGGAFVGDMYDMSLGVRVSVKLPISASVSASSMTVSRPDVATGTDECCESTRLFLLGQARG